MERELTAAPEDAGVRLDAFLAEKLPDLSRSRVQQLLEQGCILVEGKPGKKNRRLSPGDRVLLNLPEPAEADPEPEEIPLDILFEDEDLLVINKPKGMVVHPAPGHERGTLVNALLHHCGDPSPASAG